jgi:hypothetical protein
MPEYEDEVTDMNRRFMAMVIAPLLLVASTSAWAGDERPARGDRTPPPEAIEACSDRNIGDPVTIITPRGDSIKATCRQIGSQLVAVPDDDSGAPGEPSSGGPQPGR